MKSTKTDIDRRRLIHQKHMFVEQKDCKMIDINASLKRSAENMNFTK